MLYDKLPVVFLTTLASEKDGSTNSVIANYILDNIELVKNMKIKDLAKACNVGIATISRFTKEIGLTDYSQLKEMINNSSLTFELYSSSNNLKSRNLDLGDKIKESIDQVVSSVDYQAINNLIKDIDKYQNIAIFGMLKAQGVAMNLQSDLLMLGKNCYTKLSYNQQINYLRQATKDDLIIIFSYSGVYFDYEYRKLPKHIKDLNIYFITGSQDVKEFKTITFNSPLDQTSHPYQLQFVASLIAQEYGHYLKGKQNNERN